MSALFIEVTLETGEKLLINTDHIVCVTQEIKGSKVCEHGDNDIHWKVRENIRDIKNLIYYAKAEDLYQAKEINVQTT